jgi:hypothetical protein
VQTNHRTLPNQCVALGHQPFQQRVACSHICFMSHVHAQPVVTRSTQPPNSVGNAWQHPCRYNLQLSTQLNNNGRCNDNLEELHDKTSSTVFWKLYCWLYHVTLPNQRVAPLLEQATVPDTQHLPRPWLQLPSWGYCNLII